MTLLFLPDISGFTQFVKEVDLRHSRHIITELLEVLIESNSKLKLAEVEGDALFYYANANQLSTAELLEAVNDMYHAFHKHLNLYRYRRVCNCGACTTAGELQLKFIVHLGETELIEVNKQKKPFGPAVIAAHRLLKNKVPHAEYLLLSSAFWKANQEEVQGHFKQAATPLSEDVDGQELAYVFFPLEKPKINLSKPAFPQLDGSKPLILEERIKADANRVFEYLVDLSKRTEWTVGIDQLIYPENKPNSIDSDHVCVINGKDVLIKTVFSSDQASDLIYVEETKDVPFHDSFITVFRLFPKEDHTLLRFEAHLFTSQLIGKLIRPLIKRKLASGIKINLKNLAKIMESEL